MMGDSEPMTLLLPLLLLLLLPAGARGQWGCSYPGFPGGVPCGCPPASKSTGPHLRIMSMIDDRSQQTRALQREWLNSPLLLDLRYPTSNISVGPQHIGEMITHEQATWGMSGMVMFDGHILPNGSQPLVFNRATNALTPNWEAITDTFALTLKPYLANSSVQAIMVGDEIVCSGTYEIVVHLSA